MLSVLLLGFGTSMAATSAFDNVPGGAGVIYWQANTTWQTLLDLQSISALFNTTVHVTIYDMNSVDLIDFQVPFTPLDHVGFSIVGDGAGLCTITPYSDNAFGGSGLPITGQTFACPVINGLAYGYVGLVHDVTVAPPADPTIFPSNTRTNYLPGFPVLPFGADFFIMRVALLSGTTSAFGANAQMIQGFANMMTPPPGAPGAGLTELPFAVSQFIDTTAADAICALGSTVDWNNGPGTSFLTSDDPGRGPCIDSWELYATVNPNPVNGFAFPFVITDTLAGGGAPCARDFRHKSVGSWNNLYWGRYNATPGLTSSTLIMVFPASPGAAFGTADPRGANTVTIHAYNDDELWVSTGVTPDEVHRIDAGAPGFNILSDAGELVVETPTPMYGWVYTETAGDRKSVV